jgi:uncharacterized protein YjbI with pentapeptide repeats
MDQCNEFCTKDSTSHCALCDALAERDRFIRFWFKGADLRGADLEGAALLYADLEGAVLNRANLEGTDLLGAKNLTAVQLTTVSNLQIALLDPLLREQLRDLSEKPQSQ